MRTLEIAQFGAGVVLRALRHRSDAIRGCASAYTALRNPSSLFLTPSIPVVLDNHHEHAEDKSEEDGDDGEYATVVEPIGFCGVFRH